MGGGEVEDGERKGVHGGQLERQLGGKVGGGKV